MTITETVLAGALLVGWRLRPVAYASAPLLFLFGFEMTMGTGVKTALDASVFAASGAALLLASAKRYPLSFDEALETPGRQS